MITQKSLDSVLQIADNLNRSDVAISPMEGTILHDLVHASISHEVYSKAAHADSLLDMSSLLRYTNDPSTDVSISHDQVMAAAVESISNVVRNNFQLAQGHIVPITKEVYEIYTEVLKATSIQAQNPCVIMPNIYHSIWSNPTLAGLIEKYKDTPVDIKAFTYSLPSLTPIELEQMISTKISSFEEELKSWLQSLPPNMLSETYTKVFVERSIKIGDVVGPTHFTSGGFTRNQILITYFIADNFEEHMPDGLNVSLVDLQNALANIKQQAGRVLVRELERKSRDLQFKVLIYNQDTVATPYNSEGRKIIYVNNEVYQSFLKEGGSPEAIYGAVVSDSSTSYYDILKSSKEHEKSYERLNNLYKQRVAANIYAVQRDSLRVAMSRYIKNMDVDKHNIEVPINVLQQKSIDVIAKIEPDQFKYIDKLIMTVVADTLYAHTNAKMILNSMFETENKYPELDAREIAFYSAIDLLSRWFASQMSVKYN